MGSLIAQPLKNFPNFSATFIQNSNVYFEFDKGTIVIVTQIHSHCFLSAGAMIFVTFIRIVLTAPIPMYSNESVQLFKTINLDLIHTLWGSPDRFQMHGRTKLILIMDAREKKTTKHPLEWYGFSSILCFNGWLNYWWWLMLLILFSNSLNTRIKDTICEYQFFTQLKWGNIRAMHIFMIYITCKTFYFCFVANHHPMENSINLRLTT